MLSTVTALSRRAPWRVALALSMLALVLVPADVWNEPTYDGTFTGFDSITMYSDATGDGTEPGSVTMTEETLTVTAAPQSSPVVHLVNGPLSHEATFVAQVIEAEAGTVPLVVSTWAPYTNNRLELVFESEPERRILEQRFVDGVLTETTPLGVYTLGQQYRLRSVLDRNDGATSLMVTSVASDLVAGPALYLADDGLPFESHVISSVVDVEPGETYRLEAVVKDFGAGLNGLSIEWLDADGNRLDVESSWAPAEADEGWRGREMTAVAPAQSRRARVELATADSGTSLFAEVGLFENDGSVDQLAGIPLEPGTDEWRRAEGVDPLEFREFPPLEVEIGASAEEWPELFDPTRMALSVSASSTTGFSQFELSDFELRLLHQRWLAVQVDDWRQTVLVAIVGAAGLFTAAVAFADRWTRRRRGASRALLDDVLPEPRHRWVAGSAVGIYAVGNALLSQQSSLNADIIGARIWAYSVAKYGLSDIYFAPNVSSAEAVQWSGLPLQEAGFPYGPVMAYITAAQGALYRMVIDPVVGTDGGLSLDLMAKVTNGLFGILAAALVVLIVRQAGASVRTVRIAGLAVLLNPAVWFAASVWGSSQNLSVVFLLGALLMTMRGRTTWAWFLLALALMTRPQNMFPGAILGVWLLRTTPLSVTVRSMSKATIGAFVVLLPFALTVSPTLPVDNAYNALFLHVGDGNDSWTMPLSWGAMSVWPLLVPFRYAVDGVDRLLFPSTVDFVWGLSYDTAGTLLVFGLIAVLAANVVVRQRRGGEPLRLRAMMATAALGLMILHTGTPSYHMVLALILVVCCWGQLPRAAYGSSVIALTVTTFYGMYGMGAYWLTAHPDWSVGVYDDDNPVARAAASSVEQDALLTAASLVNLAVFVALFTASLRRVRHATVEPVRGPAEPARSDDWPDLTSGHRLPAERLERVDYESADQSPASDAGRNGTQPWAPPSRHGQNPRHHDAETEVN